MCYLLYLHSIGEDVDLLQNSYSQLFHIQGGPHNRLQSLPVLWFHTWVTQISNHRELEEKT